MRLLVVTNTEEALSKKDFDSWSAGKQHDWLKEHPNSKFSKRKVSKTGYNLKPGEVPKMGKNWSAHKKHEDTEHHRRHAKAHGIAYSYLTKKADKMKGKGKAAALKAADLHRRWAKRHTKMYKKLGGREKAGLEVAVTKDQFDKWSAAEKHKWLGQHPFSEFAPKFGAYGEQHHKILDPDFHKAHADKHHRMALEHSMQSGRYHQSSWNADVTDADRVAYKKAKEDHMDQAHFHLAQGRLHDQRAARVKAAKQMYEGQAKEDPVVLKMSGKMRSIPIEKKDPSDQEDKD